VNVDIYVQALRYLKDKGYINVKNKMKSYKN